VLARVPVVEIASVVEDGTVLAADDYEVDASSGLLTRLCDDRPRLWACGKVVVTYAAGWGVVPDDLRMAAAKLARLLKSEASRDPKLRSERIPDVLEQSFWVSRPDEPALPADIEELLAPYRHVLIG
ncbi:MAG TPA: hypothetical protein VM434_18635, partial [Beijerinckiaceae bacterium]|nr:hypothetical protein [Beijerinckiaceae bacterium]